MKINSVIIKPVLTEKATQAAQTKTYTFEVSEKANKNQVKSVLETMFSVKISDVRIVVRKGKTKKVGRKMVLKTLPKRKLAFVSVKEGTINVFPQV